MLNKHAVELGIRAALALHLNVQEFSRFARKNYFYPDLPKGYQISMYELPLATAGHLEIEHDGQVKRVSILDCGRQARRCQRRAGRRLYGAALGRL